MMMRKAVEWIENGNTTIAGLIRRGQEGPGGARRGQEGPGGARKAPPKAI